jgi:large repetitive protein
MTTNSIKNAIHSATKNIIRKEIALVLLVVLVAAATAFGQNPIATPPVPVPVPAIGYLFPASVTSGGGTLALHVFGSNFVSGSQVQWNGVALVTQFNSANALTATVPTTLTANGGTALITVSNPGAIPVTVPVHGAPAIPGTPAKVSNVFYYPVNVPITTLADQRINTAAGTAPFGLTAADFDGDGKLDLAVANNDDDTVSILLGNGDGTFKTQTTFATVGSPYGIATGDLNGDGHADLVVGSTGGQGLTIALGDGTGAFTVTTLSASGCLAYPVLADVNGDGNLDIVVGNECGNGIQIFLGDGTGNFTAATPLGGTGVSGVYQVVVADFNADGILDIAAAASTGTNVYMYLGDGTGGFSAATAVPAVSGAWAIAAGDFDGDHNLDLVVTSNSGSGFSVLLGKGDGTFGAGTSISADGSYRAIAVADMNDDGNLDFVTSASPGGVMVWLGDGDGNVSDAPIIGPGTNSLGIVLANFATAGTLGVATDTANGVSVLQPTISLSPTFANFGNVNVNSTAQQVFTVSNGTASGVEITEVSLGLANNTEDEFTQANTCGSNDLAPGASCTITVTFAPLASGSAETQLVVFDSAPGGSQTANMIADGIGAPVATLSTASLTFGNQNLNVASASIPVTLTNSGTGPLTGVAVSVNGTNSADFTQTNNCPLSLPVNHVCTVNVTFTPSLLGAESASLQFVDNAANTPQLVTLSGSGVQVATQLLYIVAPPTTIVAGGNIGTITVGVYTMQSMLITSSNAEIRITITGPGSFNQGLSAGAVSGVATFDFSGVPLDTAGQYTITAAIDNGVRSKSRRVVRAGGGGVASAVATTLVTAQGSSAQMTVAGYPSPTFAGFAHTFTVSVTDTFLNPITTYTGTVTLSSSDVDAVLTPSPYTFVSGDMGAHSFTGTLNTLGTQTISATDGQLSGVQTGIVVNSAPHFIVNTLADDTGTAVCDGQEPCSFRSAITLSNTAGEGLITVDTTQFQGSAPFSSTLTNGVLVLTGNISITGPSSTGLLTISGNNASAIFQVNSGAVVTISALSLTDGFSSTDGGAISNAGTLSLSNLQVAGSLTETNGGAIANTGTMTFTGSTVAASDSSGSGGGIANSGTLTITNSTVNGNFAPVNGGGLLNSGTLTVTRSTVSGNSSEVNGGAVSNTGTAIFYDSTISGNEATVNGGAFDNNGSLSLPQSSIIGNSAVDGSAIENEAAGTIVLLQCTVNQNSASGNTSGTITNLNDSGSAVKLLNTIDAGNTSGSGGDCVACGTQSSFNALNVPEANLGLGELTNNGGPTQTVAPQPGSVALGAGSVPLIAGANLPQSFADDQRGAGFARVVNNMVDLGAVETQSLPAATELLLAVNNSAVAGQPLTVTVTGANECDNPVTSFTDTVHFTSSDPLAVLPADYTFVGGDAGVHVFSVTLKTGGTQTLTVTDIQHPLLTATQTLSVSAGPASSIIALAGSGQTANPGDMFATALEAKVTDAFGNAIPAISITFTAPTTGASGTFAGGVSTATVATLTTGIATAPAFTANSTAGQYTVTAGVASQQATIKTSIIRAGAPPLTPASFTLTNGVPPSYTVTANPATLSIVQGQSGTTVLTFTPVGGFTGTVSLSCSGLPANSDCVFVPSQAVMTGNDAVVTVTLTVNTTGANGQLSQLWPSTHRGPDVPGSSSKLPALFGMLLAIAILGWSTTRAKRPRYALAAFAMLVVVTGVGLTACTHSHTTTSTTPATVPGTYPVNVTASVGSGGTQTAVVMITIVQQ